MKQLLKYASKYWHLYLIAIISMIISICLDAMAPQITRRIIDDVIVGGELKILMSLLWGLLGIGFGRAIFQYIKEFIFDTTSARIGCRIRKNLFDHIQTLSMGYFDNHNTGELMARVKDDVDRVWNALGFVGMLVIECVFHTVIVVFCMFQISPVLTLLPLIVMPVIAYGAIKMEKGLGEVYEKISEETAQLNTVAQENLAGVRTVKSFAREDHEMDKFRRHNGQYYHLNMAQARLIVKFQPNISFLTKLLLMAVIVAGGILVINDRITIGDLGAFCEYANNIIWPMEIVGWLSNDIAAAMASNKKINKILAEEPQIKNPDNLETQKVMEGNLRFENVDFSMNSNRILTDISFNLEKGKTLGIMGMTGSGKTTIVNLIQRFYDVSSGRITMDGVDIRMLPLPQLRGQAAVVMQDVFLFSDSISENIKTGNRDFTEWETVEQASVCADAHGFISKLSEQYDTVIGERGVGLSGGQKQRISIARAIAKQPPLLILDDSTSALDMETEHDIQNRLESLDGCSKIIIAHRISAVRHADEILILEKGRIAERGTHKELMNKKGLYYETYQVQYGEEGVQCQ